MTSNTPFPLSSHTSNMRLAPRRPNHGNTAAFSISNPLLQPQDGAPIATPAKVEPINARQHALLGSEPEDARLTGSTRSLFRRVMGLNVGAVVEKVLPLTKPRAAQKVTPTAEALPAEQQVA